jgi:hypothetical protein
MGAGARAVPTVPLARRLEVVLDRPSELHDQLNAVLGLQELNDVAARLADQRKAQEDVAKPATRSLDELKRELPHSLDPRAGEALRLVSARKPDLDSMEALATGSSVPPAGELKILDALRGLSVPASDDVQAFHHRLRETADELDRTSSSAAGMASDSADLLAAAVAHFEVHGPGDCPVCRRAGALDDGWLVETKAQVERLRLEAEEMRRAQDIARDAAAAVTPTFAPLRQDGVFDEERGDGDEAHTGPDGQGRRGLCGYGAARHQPDNIDDGSATSRRSKWRCHRCGARQPCCRTEA